MPKIHLSHIKDREGFENAVKKHIARLKAANFEHNKPRPTADPLVEQSIKRVPGGKDKPDDYQADYEIVDDINTVPERSLDEKKRLWHDALIHAEVAAKNAVIPQRKVRLVNLAFSAALNVAEDVRSDADKKTIADHQEMVKKMQDIELIAATAESEIEDLTDATVDNWKLPNFQ